MLHISVEQLVLILAQWPIIGMALGAGTNLPLGTSFVVPWLLFGLVIRMVGSLFRGSDASR